MSIKNLKRQEGIHEEVEKVFGSAYAVGEYAIVCRVDA